MKKFTKFLAVLFLSFGVVCGLLACDDTSGTQNPTTQGEKFEIVIPNVEHGKVTASSTSVEKGQNVELTVSPDSNYELEYLKANDVTLTVANNKATIENVTEKQTITASFIGVEVVVTFVVDGETLSTKNVRYGSTYGELPAAGSMVGYEFGGWYTEADGDGELVTKDSSVANAGAHELYAYYTPLSFTIYIIHYKCIIIKD